MRKNDRPDAAELISDVANLETATDVKIVLGEIMDAFGGAKAFAHELVTGIHLSEKGSSLHIQALNNILRALLQFGFVAGDEGLEDEETIRAVVRQLLQEEQAYDGNGDGPEPFCGDD